MSEFLMHVTKIWMCVQWLVDRLSCSGHDVQSLTLCLWSTIMVVYFCIPSLVQSALLKILFSTLIYSTFSMEQEFVDMSFWLCRTPNLIGAHCSKTWQFVLYLLGLKLWIMNTLWEPQKWWRVCALHFNWRL